MDFIPFPKIARLSRDIVITEKLDGTNAQVTIIPFASSLDHSNAICAVGDMLIFAGSRSRWLTPGKTTDNYGFAMWVNDNAEQLADLGVGQHFGEWWGKGIQRGYGLDHKRFSLFNVHRWAEDANYVNGQQPCPDCCHVVPVLYKGPFPVVHSFDDAMDELRQHGSVAAPGFMNPEGIIVYHSGANVLFKKTFDHDSTGKEAA